MTQIDRELELAENYMNALTCYNNTSVYLTNQNSSNFYYAANTINQEMSRDSLYYQYVSGVFLYVPDSDFYYIHALEDIIQKYIADELANQTGTGWKSSWRISNCQTAALS